MEVSVVIGSGFIASVHVILSGTIAYCVVYIDSDEVMLDMSFPLYDINFENGNVVYI